MFDGRIMGTVERGETDLSILGLMMAGGSLDETLAQSGRY